MPITKEGRDELRRLLAAATPRPWYADGWAIWDDDADEYVEIHDTSVTARLLAAAVNALPDLLDALDEAERIAESRDVINRTYALTVDLLSSDLRSAIAERDLYKARAEIYERAIRGDCTYCIGTGCKTPGGQHMPCACINGNAWQFDEARFTPCSS